MIASHPLTIASRAVLNNDVQMPVLGFGTWRLQGPIVTSSVTTAIQAGCRLIDTASMYGNEVEVGEGIRASGVPREDVFVTSKLWSHEHGRQESKEACAHSLERLGLDHLDLYLIHWPSGGHNLETWTSMIELLEEGKTRAIGVSNFSIEEIEALVKGTGVVPSVDQVEFNPYRHDDDLLAECTGQGIVVEAYSPLSGVSLQDPALVEVAGRNRRSVAQVVLRWCLQKGTVALFRSSRPEHISENTRVFDFKLPPEDMRTIDRIV